MAPRSVSQFRRIERGDQRVDGWGPVRDFLPVSGALPGAFRGGGSFIGGDSSSQMLVGTPDGLVKYNSGAWDVLASGMTITGQWRFVQFGNFVVGVNGSQTKVTVLSSGVTTDLATAPAGTSIAVVGDYVVIGQDAGDILGVTTSGFNDHTDWDYTNPLSSSTFQPMLAGGEVMGVASGEYGVILQRQRLVRMNRTGDNAAPFSYDEITPNIGCASKGSVAQAGRSVYFLSDRGFMALQDGQSITPIGSEKVDRYFQSRVAREEYESLYASVDPQRKLVVWCYAGSPGFLLVYHYELDRWSIVEIGCEGIFSGFTSSTTLEAISAIYPDIDTMPYSLDDPRFSGGSPRFYLVQDGMVGAMTGDNLPASFEYSFSQVTPGLRTRFRSVRPITDCIVGNVVSLDVRHRLGDVPSPVTASEMRDSGVMPIRASGMFVRPAWEIAAGADWTYAQGLSLEYDAGGER
jgi:hypothetical protein